MTFYFDTNNCCCFFFPVTAANANNYISKRLVPVDFLKNVVFAQRQNHISVLSLKQNRGLDFKSMGLVDLCINLIVFDWCRLVG